MSNDQKNNSAPWKLWTTVWLRPRREECALCLLEAIPDDSILDFSRRSMTRRKSYPTIHRWQHVSQLISGDYLASERCAAMGSLVDASSDGLPPLIHGAVRFGQRKGRDLDIKLIGRLIDHLVGSMHWSKGSREGTAWGVFKALAGSEHGLFANDARTLDLFHFSHAVGDNPMAAHELHCVVAFVRNVDGVKKKPLTVLRAGAARVILRLDAHPDVSCCGFWGEHLFAALW
jgi:hypothetical protein